MNENIIALDGPAGSGKSTVAREIAKAKGFYYMDSGAYYRALTLYLMEKLPSQMVFQYWMETGEWKNHYKNAKLDTVFESSDENKTFLNDKDVSKEIRLPAVTEEIKHIAAILEIRQYVNENLYKLSQKYKIVMDGRDIGTEVFPDARYKFFLSASPDIRAKRRWLEFKEKGIEMDLETLKQDIIRRDESDMNRKVAPLKQAADAILVDSSVMSKEEVKEFIISRIG